jgi:hypothetical protein
MDKMIDNPVFNTCDTSPCEDNGNEPFSKMFYEFVSAVGGILHHSTIRNPSRLLIYFVCTY